MERLKAELTGAQNELVVRELNSVLKPDGERSPSDPTEIDHIMATIYLDGSADCDRPSFAHCWVVEFCRKRNLLRIERVDQMWRRNLRSVATASKTAPDFIPIGFTSSRSEARRLQADLTLRLKQLARLRSRLDATASSTN